MKTKEQIDKLNEIDKKIALVKAKTPEQFKNDWILLVCERGLASQNPLEKISAKESIDTANTIPDDKFKTKALSSFTKRAVELEGMGDEDFFKRHYDCKGDIDNLYWQSLVSSTMEEDCVKK